jgi:hypothetical protein
MAASTQPSRWLAGFVITKGDELEQLYVDAAARGTQVAAALLEHGEQRS